MCTLSIGPNMCVCEVCWFVGLCRPDMSDVWRELKSGDPSLANYRVYWWENTQYRVEKS